MEKMEIVFWIFWEIYEIYERLHTPFFAAKTQEKWVFWTFFATFFSLHMHYKTSCISHLVYYKLPISMVALYHLPYHSDLLSVNLCIDVWAVDTELHRFSLKFVKFMVTFLSYFFAKFVRGIQTLAIFLVAKIAKEFLDKI